MFSVTILASSSKGNATLVATNCTRLLVDAGLSCRRLEDTLRKIGLSPADLDGILLTHEHSDHASGLPVLLKKYPVPLFCSPTTYRVISPQLTQPPRWIPVEAGRAIELADLQMETFPVPHDAYDPVGLLLRHAQGCFGIVTDLGYVTGLVIERLREARGILLEANYEMELLQKDPKRPWSIKQRIISRHGHLSNEAAAELVAALARAELREVYLGHLSEDCNDPALAKRRVMERLGELAAQVKVEVILPSSCPVRVQWGPSHPAVAQDPKL
ncbi:MBL fold metallo-hydrolase [Candidatus Methylacidithermus pantelleriae]|nr:MBL fold metallo-hydrolase [Candidatus Methylacidithermus pantelleriae]